MRDKREKNRDGSFWKPCEYVLRRLDSFQG